MEQTTLQQRIEERAKSKLEKVLIEMSNKEKEIQNQLGRDNYIPQLEAWYHTGYSPNYLQSFRADQKTQELFKKLLPSYIQQVTDEILQKIDQIDYLLDSKQQSEYVD